MSEYLDDYGRPLSINQTPIGDQPGDYPMPTTAQTPGFATTWTGGLSGTSGDQEGDYPMPTTGQTPGWASGFSLDKLLSSIFGTGGLKSQIGEKLSTPSGALTGLLGLYALSQMGKTSPSQYAGYTGSIPKLTATRQALQAPVARKYGEGAQGQQFFTPVTYAATGKYLRGDTDGMADKLDTTIDDTQPAKLSHGEFVVPADVVSHLGNGNSDAGANVLYKMMDRVRKARTGTTKQGKRINPDKFTPGGIAGYADGGAVAFAGDNEAGSLVKAATTAGVPVSQSSSLSPWAGDYVTQMLGQAQALGQMPYQPYMGQLTAGTSPLQQQAYSGLSALAGGYPGQYDIASQFAAQAGQRAGQAQYTPGQFTMGQVNAPSLQDIQMQGPADVTGAQAQAAQLAAAPTAQAAAPVGIGGLQTYQMGPAQQVGTQSFSQLAAQGLMSPYMQSVVDVQQQQAQRQADIANQAQKAQFAQAGAFGGSRFGVQQAQAAADLARQKQGIQAQGLQSAYQQAQQQFNTQQQAALQAALANQQAGLTTGGQNLAAALGVQQLGTQSGLQAALANQQAQQQAALANQALAGQYGLQQGQFGQQAALQNAQMAQQAALANQQMGYNTGLQNLQARLGIQQLGAGQNLQAQLANQQALMQAQQAAEQSRQFGAGYGMQGIGQQLGAAGQLGQLGAGQFGTQLQGIQALLGAGGTQQQTEQQALTALQNQYQQQMMWPYQQLQFQQSMLGGLPIGTTTAAAQTGALGPIANLLGGLGGIYKTIGGFGG